MKSSAMSTKPNLRAVSSGYSPASGAQWKFLGDIESIMWAMGDCRRPLQQSAKLIEDAMSRSVRLLMAEAQSVAESRGESWLGAEDLLFVLRKDRPTLLRLIRHMKIRDLRASTL